MSEKLGTIAKFLRSKNSGPFKLTLDVFFHSRQDYERVRGAGVLTPDSVADVYLLDDGEAVSVFAFDSAAAIKVTMPRRIASGAVGDTEIYGAQQHGPLLDIAIPD